MSKQYRHTNRQYEKRINDKEQIQQKCKGTLDKFPLQPQKYEPIIIWLLNDLRLATYVKTSQIRQVLTGITQIWQKQDIYQSNVNKLQTEVFKIKTKLIYAAGRNRGVKTLSYVLYPLLGEIKDWKHFEDFFVFFQAFIAYHKYHGGKD